MIIIVIDNKINKDVIDTRSEFTVTVTPPPP